MTNKRNISSALKILLSFLVISFVGCFLFCLPLSHNDGKWFSFVDGLFTSISATCVTGLSVIDTTLNLTLFGQIVLLILIQIGGLGFITINSLLFLILGKKITFQKRLTIKEMFNQESVQGMVKLVKKILIFVFVTELIGAICLLPSFINIYGFWSGFFKSVFMSVSSFCNAGFDVLGNKISQFQSLNAFSSNSYVLIISMLLTIFGGVGFITIFELPKIFNREKLSLHAKVTLIFTFALTFGGACIFALLEWNNPSTLGNFTTWDKIINCIFLSVSPRTVGFSAINMQNLTSGSIALTIALMFVGAGSASTAGGIKVTTLFLMLLIIFKKTKHDGDIVFNKQQISFKTTRKAVKIFNLYIFLSIVSSIALCCLDGFSFETSLFEVVSALSTVGLSLGITSVLSVLSKFILMVLMIIGRVGIITISIAILKNEEENTETKINYQEAKLLVGWGDKRWVKKLKEEWNNLW